jgi:hypothetical protein
MHISGDENRDADPGSAVDHLAAYNAPGLADSLRVHCLPDVPCNSYRRTFVIASNRNLSASMDMHETYSFS